MKETKLIPVLRFPEFNKEWQEDTLGNIASFSKGKGISKANIIEDGELECIRYGELYTEYSEVIDKVKSKTNLSSDNLVLSEGNDVIIPASGETQIDIATASCVLRSGVALGGDLNIIKTPLNGVFLSYYLNYARRKKIARLAQGISVVHLYSNQLKGLKLAVPQLEEQQKIATFLTAIDKRIKLLTQKKEELERYKKGMMQNIFNRDIRFKNENGEEFSEWKEFKAKEIFHSHSNKNHNGKLPILSASQEHGMIYRNESGLRIQSSQKSILSYKIVEPGDFVISLRSFQGGIDFSNKKGICSPAYTILKNSLPISTDFFKYYFKKEDFIERLSKTVVGIRDGKQITYDAFGTLKIPFPSVKEQRKIASFISSIDSSIENISQQIDTSTDYKKSLLQLMFV